MFKFFRKHRLFFDIMAIIVFALGSYLNFSDYFSTGNGNATEHKMDLFGGIIFGIMVIIKLTDIVGVPGNRKVE